MDIEREIAELKVKLAELEAKANEPLDCYFGYGCMIGADGTIAEGVTMYSDSDYTQIRNKEIAEAAMPLVQIQRALINFKCEHDNCHFKFMWGASGLYQKKWYIEIGNTLDTNFSTSIQKVGVVYFSTKELAQSALDMLKRRKLI